MQLASVFDWSAMSSKNTGKRLRLNKMSVKKLGADSLDRVVGATAYQGGNTTNGGSGFTNCDTTSVDTCACGHHF